MTASVEAWLATQTREHLEDGAVGLYELTSWLDSSRFGLDLTRVRQLARDLVCRLVREGAADLYLLVWPDYLVLAGPLPEAVLDDDDAWRPGNRFVALASAVTAAEGGG